jgi:ClpA/ClpB-like protein
MFEQYSKRALEVIFAARLKAGERGSGAIDVGDLVVGLVLEDQGKMADLLSLELPQSGVVIGLDAHPPFIQPEAADRLLLSVDNILTHSTPVSTSVDLPVIAGLQAVFKVAEEIKEELGHERTEPLHLMAGILREESGVFSNELQAVGITQDLVMAKLRDDAGGTGERKRV